MATTFLYVIDSVLGIIIILLIALALIAWFKKKNNLFGAIILAVLGLFTSSLGIFSRCFFFLQDIHEYQEVLSRLLPEIYKYFMPHILINFIMSTVFFVLIIILLYTDKKNRK